ncbi:MAG: sigma-70 family RNA polymerase sigma factor [Acidimicrobiales bacterium]
MGTVSNGSTRGELSSAAEFSRFYREYSPTVYGYLHRLCAGDRAVAEDLTQDTWFALVRELGAGNDQCADVRWLLVVARSRFIDWARREQRAVAKLSLLRSTVDDIHDETIETGEVVALLDELRPLHRVVLVMRYVEGMPVPAIAGELGRSVTSTNSLLARARAELRRTRQGGSDE